MAQTKPGDLIGHDASGNVRIDRVIPLPWVLGMLAGVIVQAVTLWFQVQAATETVREIKGDLRALVAWQGQSSVKDAETAADVRDLRRRVEALEAKR